MNVDELAPPAEAVSQWTTDWLNGVADGTSTMSQRTLASIEKRGGGLAAVKAQAEARGVHLLLVQDDRGHELVAASRKPFQVVC